MTEYYCTNCDKTFSAEGEDKPRCPECLRSTGIGKGGDQAASKGGISPAVIIGVVAVALAGGGLLWYLTRNSKPSEAADRPPPGVTVVKNGGPKTPKKSEPSPVKVAKDTGPNVAKLVTQLVGGAEGGPSAQAAVLAAALPPRLEEQKLDQRLGRDVLDAEAAAAKLLATTEPVRLTGIEAGNLALALARALELEAEPVVLLEPHGGKTLLAHRRLGVRVKGVTSVLSPLSDTGMVESGAKAAPAGYPAAMVQALRARYALERQRFEEATRLLGEAMKTFSDDPALRFLRGQIAMVRGNIDDGLQEMQAAVGQAEDAEGRYQLGIALLRADQTFKAFQALRRAVALDPKHAQAWSALAHLTLQRLQTAPDVQKKAVEAELDEIQKALTAIGKDAPGLIELRVRRLMLAGKKDEAYQLASEAVTLYEKRPALYMLLAELAKAKGEDASAIRNLEAAAKVDPDNPEPMLRLAALHSDGGDVEAALKALAEASKRAPFDADLMVQLATNYIQSQKMAEAEAVAKTLHERFPERVEGPLILVQMHMGRGEVEQAIALADATLAKNKRATELHVLLYLIHLANREPEKAASRLDALLAYEPEARMMIAQQLLQAGMAEGALALMEEELSAKPRRLEVAIALAQLYLVLGKEADVKRLRKHVADNADDKDKALATFDQKMEEAEEQSKGGHEGHDHGPGGHEGHDHGPAEGAAPEDGAAKAATPEGKAAPEPAKAAEEAPAKPTTDGQAAPPKAEGATPPKGEAAPAGDKPAPKEPEGAAPPKKDPPADGAGDK